MKTTMFARLAARWMRRPPRPRPPQPDPVRDHLRAAVAAEARAQAAGAETYHARVEAMIDDFFVKYGSRDVRRLH